MRTTMIVGLACLTAATGACQRAAPPPREAPPVTTEVAPAKAPRTTRLSAMGCSVQLPGSWRRVAGDDASSGSWAAEAEDGAATLSVLPMPWSAADQPGGLREGLDAILDLRRHVDQDERGPRVVLSAKEFVDDPTSPAALYTTFDPAAGELFATMARATPKMACVLLLTGGGADPAELQRHARSVLQTVVVEK